MNSALLRKSIEILSLQTESTVYGNNKSTYVHKCNARCHTIFSSQSEVVSEGEVLFPVTRTFIVRNNTNVIETDRIVYDNKQWKINSINRNEYYNNIEINTVLVNT